MGVFEVVNREQETGGINMWTICITRKKGLFADNARATKKRPGPEPGQKQEVMLKNHDKHDNTPKKL